MQMIVSIDGSLIVASYEITFKGINDDIPQELKAMETTVFSYLKTNWKIQHCHSSNKIMTKIK